MKGPVRLWIDTEFNGMGGELISIALVDEHGLAFYESLGCKAPVPWVAANVMPIIGKPALPRTTVQQLLATWLAPYPAIHVIADWPDDISHFCQLLITGPGRRIETPPLTLEIRRDIDGKSKVPHNALADAIAIRAAHLELERTAASLPLEAVEFNTFSVYADTEFRDADGKLMAVVRSGEHHRRMTLALRTALTGEVKP